MVRGAACAPRYREAVRDESGSTSQAAAEWGVASRAESRIPVLAAVLVAIALQVILPDSVLRGLGNRALLPGLEGLVLIALLVGSPTRISAEERRLRVVGIGLIALVTVVNFVSLTELIHALLYSPKTAGRPLVYASVPIWLTNVIAFGLWYWELDRGGPAARCQPSHRRPDFFFPQMGNPGVDEGWTPGFSDYLYTSFTNATAFSPTDTMPLTSWAKLLMAMQSLASLITVAVVVSRAVNILARRARAAEGVPGGGHASSD
jgi:uncharacterized membrane protein